MLWTLPRWRRRAIVIDARLAERGTYCPTLSCVLYVHAVASVNSSSSISTLAHEAKGAHFIRFEIRSIFRFIARVLRWTWVGYKRSSSDDEREHRHGLFNSENYRGLNDFISSRWECATFRPFAGFLSDAFRRFCFILMENWNMVKNARDGKDKSNAIFLHFAPRSYS